MAGRRQRAILPKPSAAAPPTVGRPAGPWISGPWISGHWIYGRHAVTAALANPARRWRRLAALAARGGEAHELAAAALARRLGAGEAVQLLDRARFAALLPEGAVHQGLALEIEPLAEPSLTGLLEQHAPGSARRIVVALDRVEDPQNVGAVLRAAAAFGAEAVLVARHGAPPVTGALAKAASGALETVPLVRIGNLVRAFEQLKEAGFWVCGLDATAAEPLAALDLSGRVVLVLGSEGGGMRRLVREHCDYLARLPTSQAQPTLNVANAAAVALYELVRRAAPG